MYFRYECGLSESASYAKRCVSDSAASTGRTTALMLPLAVNFTLLNIVCLSHVVDL